MSKSELKNEYTMTKYEKARILGIRALQINNGTQPMVNTNNLTDAMDIANKELMEYKMPFIIRRKYPDGSYIDIKLSDMIIC